MAKTKAKKSGKAPRAQAKLGSSKKSAGRRDGALQFSTAVLLFALLFNVGTYYLLQQSSVELESAYNQQLASLPTKSGKTTMDVFDELSPEQLYRVGQQFAYGSIAKMLFKDSETADDREYSFDATVDMLSLKVSSEEKKARKLTHHTKETGVNKLRSMGVVALQNVMPASLCDAVYQDALAMTQAAKEEMFGNIMEADFRKDLPQVFNANNVRFLRVALGFTGGILEDILGKDPILVEYSSLISFPGAKQQDMHPDSGMEQFDDLETAQIVSVFCYLTDVAENMAALDVIPRTHTHYHFADEDEIGVMADRALPVRMVVPFGSVVMMNSRTHHRGSENMSPRNRPVFYFSFMQSGKPPPDGPTYSLRDEYAAKKYNLTTLMNLLDKDFPKSKRGEKDNDPEPEETPASALAQKKPKRRNKIARVEVRNPHVHELTTQNYNASINASEYSFVLFYDPRSQSSIVLQPQFEAAAKTVSTGEYGDVVKFHSVDSSRHAFLTERVVPIFSDIEQDPSDGAPFLFGKPNFFPFIMILFHNGKMKEEYVSVVDETHIEEYLNRYLASRKRSGAIGRATALDTIATEKFVAVGCFKDTNASLNLNVTKMQDAFRAVSKELNGWMAFLELDANPLSTDELCKSPVQFYASGSYIESFNLPSAFLVSNRLHDVLEVWLSAMMSGASVNQLTPDNSHMFLDKPEPLVMALLHKQETEENAKIKSEMLKISSRLGYNKVQLAWADGKEFANQFGVKRTKDALPRIVLVNNLIANDDMQFQLMDDKKGHGIDQVMKAMKNENMMDEYDLSFNESQANFLSALQDYLNDAKDNRQGGGDNSSTSGLESTSKGEDENKNVTSNTSEILKTAQGNDTETPKTEQKRDLEMEKFELLSEYESKIFELYQYMDYQHKIGLPPKEATFVRERVNDILKTIRDQWKDGHGFDILVRSPEALREIFKKGEKSVDLLRNAIETDSKNHSEGSREKVYTVDDAKKMVETLDTAVGELIEQFENDLREKKIAQKEELYDSENVRKVHIDRYDWEDLSMDVFINEYAKKKRPVIIQNLPMTKTPWTLSHIKKVCGEVEADLVKRDKNTSNWGGLVDAESMLLKEFIDTFNKNETRAKYYLHDWTLTSHCPKIFGEPPYEEYNMPKYFAGDYFQRVFPSGYQHSWPSLFIGANGTQSDLHVDSGGTNFWLYLISGEKEWRFFPREDFINLYPRSNTAKFEVDSFNPDLKKHPLFQKATMFYAIQKPGDLVFIPGGCPHAVRNNADIHALSMNYVDASNFYLHLWVMLQDREYRSFELFSNGNFREGLSSTQEHLTFGEFKSMDWENAELDLF
jgi:hypothetical protein